MYVCMPTPLPFPSTSAGVPSTSSLTAKAVLHITFTISGMESCDDYAIVRALTLEVFLCFPSTCVAVTARVLIANTCTQLLIEPNNITSLPDIVNSTLGHLRAAVELLLRRKVTRDKGQERFLLSPSF